MSRSDQIASASNAAHMPAPALVIVDMQNDFVRVGAPLEVPAARDTIASIKKLLKAFRDRALPVFHTRFIGRPEDEFFNIWNSECAGEQACCHADKYRIYQGFDTALPCWEIIEELKPLGQEVVIDKFSYGAFHGTKFHEALQAAQIKSLVVAGTVTQICVDETARQAFYHGYATTIASDCVSSYAADLHDATLKNFAHKFGWVSDSTSIISKL